MKAMMKLRYILGIFVVFVMVGFGGVSFGENEIVDAGILEEVVVTAQGTPTTVTVPSRPPSCLTLIHADNCRARSDCLRERSEMGMMRCFDREPIDRRNCEAQPCMAWIQ